jgi:hypothetical protein
MLDCVSFTVNEKCSRSYRSLDSTSWQFSSARAKSRDGIQAARAKYPLEEIWMTRLRLCNVENAMEVAERLCDYAPK